MTSDSHSGRGIGLPLDLRAWLRTLPNFPSVLPPAHSTPLPSTPDALFLEWMTDAVAAGQMAARAMTLSTVGADAHAHARTVLLTDLDARGWQFATDAQSPKGRELAANPSAALTFFWPVRGRQVRLSGLVAVLPRADAERDFRARSAVSRAANLVCRQSEPLDTPADYSTAFAEAEAALSVDPDQVPAEWTAYALQPERVEFWQSVVDGPPTRLLYRRAGAGWVTQHLWP